MGTLSRQNDLRMAGYRFGGFSGTPPSEPNLSTPPPPPGRERVQDAALILIISAVNGPSAV